MITIQIRLTDEQLKEIDKLVKRGYYPNRSEAIRNMLSAYLFVTGVNNGIYKEK